MGVRVNMRIVALAFLTIVGVFASIAAISARADECDQLSCDKLCQADRRSCLALRLTLRDWLQAFCKSDADDQRFDCVDAKTNVDESCALLCGDEFKQCMKVNSDTLKLCISSIQVGIASCKADTRSELDDARAGCQTDFDQCEAECSGT